MRPDYDPVAQMVPEDEVDLDNDQVYWRAGARLDGVLGERLGNGNFEYLTYRDGIQDGPAGELTPDGDFVYEEWYRGNFRYGITRWFRPDGTIRRAACYEYSVEVWSVEFAEDGRRSTTFRDLSDADRRVIEIFRRDAPLPPIPGPEAAGDLAVH
ncbi:hypothetical protein AB0B28_02125 [Glycomyces sp. NPDC046736]|uniref:hypothetical protein n=1 Tax=Glycomyces sp. NPDC046736 TaxID=3155615 RepID=UPI0033F89368